MAPKMRPLIGFEIVRRQASATSATDTDMKPGKLGVITDRLC